MSVDYDDRMVSTNNHLTIIECFCHVDTDNDKYKCLSVCLLRFLVSLHLNVKETFMRGRKKVENEQMFERTVKPVLDVQDKPKATQWRY